MFSEVGANSEIPTFEQRVVIILPPLPKIVAGVVIMVVVLEIIVLLEPFSEIMAPLPLIIPEIGFQESKVFPSTSLNTPHIFLQMPD